MGKISTGIGLFSGIPSKDIIDQLISLEERPKLLLQSRKDKLAAQKTAYQGIITKLTGLQTVSRAFQRPSTFANASAKSSDENVLTATTSAGAAVGSFRFQVARLVTAQQSITGGFSSADATVGAGTLTVEMGGGNLNAPTELSGLNGGAGVRRGAFRVTDRSGKSAVVDVSDAITVDDVLRKINTSLDVSVRATLSGDKIVITDRTGLTTGNLSVQDVGDGQAAADLGIARTIAASTLTGNDVQFLGDATALSSLNDGRGVRALAAGDANADFRVTVRDGTAFDVKLGSSRTVGDVIKAINAAGGTKLTASLGAGGNGITLTDTTAGGSTFAVTALNSSKAAADLGILKSGAGGTLSGEPVLAGLNTVLLSSLKGGAGLSLGTISITDRGGMQQNVDLSGAKTLQNVLDAINTSGVKVIASLNASGNGIDLVDDSGGTDDLVITDVGGGTTAAQLGIAGTFDATRTAVKGANLQIQWVNENTLLSAYNGGKGVTPGAFTVTNSAGVAVDVDLSTGTFNNLGDVITAINAKAVGVTASINANGDGLLLTDTAGGAGKLKVVNKTGTTATGLNIASTAAATTIDGSFEKMVVLTATDTLTTVQEKLRTLNFGVSAAIVNDGSGHSPHRLSLTAFNPGRAGRVVFDAGATALETRNLVEAQDAAVFLGGGESTGAGASPPLLITSSKNQLANVIPGVTIDLNGVSEEAVTLNITRDAESVVEQAKKFVEDFNAVTTSIKELTKYDVEKKQAGLLLGEATARQVEAQMYRALQGVVTGAGRYRILADVGLKVGEGAKLEFNEEKFREAFAADPEAVKNLFAQAASGLSPSTSLSALNSGRGVRTASTGADFRVTLRDATTFDVTVSADGTVGDVIAAINTAAAGKATIAVASDGKALTLTDNTTGGTGTLAVSTLNGSAAAIDLGLTAVASGPTLNGTTIHSGSGGALASGGGFGHLIERSMKLLVDPVDGVLSRQNKTIDDRSQQFQSRMDSLDKLIAAKRARLERQFANLETVLAGLQSQQSALSSLGSISQPPAAAASGGAR